MSKMNNKGFTLTEVLATIFVISLIIILIAKNATGTISMTKEKSYEIMKKNIISSSYDYLNECDAKTIECDFSFDNNNTFPVKILKENGYFKNLNSPIDGKDLSNCLIIKAIKENGITKATIKDNCY